VTERNDAERQAAVGPRQDGRFAGKVAFITGSTSAIGRATALAFAREGASVVVADIAASSLASGGARTTIVSRARGRNRSAGRAVPTSQQDLIGVHPVSLRPATADTGPDGGEITVNLEQLRKQARDLVRAARAGDLDALGRLGGREPILARAQLVVAREQGYASWPALVAAAEASVDTFVIAATEQRRARAQALLAARPEIEHDPWARLVLGREWRGDPNAPGGPRGWAPLLYVTHSCFASVELARELLARGADPDAFFVNEYGRMSALYGAAGRVHDPKLTQVLLEAGANPDDGESLYHATEAESPDCLRMILEFGAATEGTNALAHALDDDRPEHVRLLLEAGFDVHDAAYVAHAVRRGRGPAIVRLLVEHGAPIDRPGGETWRGDAPLRTPYQHAVLRGRDDVASTLAELGASTDVDPPDLAVAAVARGERPAAPLPARLDPDAQEVLILAALRGRLESVVDTLGVDFHGVVGGSPDGTLLHHACWVGDPSVVSELLARGADPMAQARADLDTPLAWAALASQYHELPGRDYVAVAELLTAGGAVVEPRFLDVADGPLADWLEERLAS
jgi:ankyrin repeat protein